MSSALPDIEYIATCDYETFIEVVNSLTPEIRDELIKMLKNNYFNSNNPSLFPDDRYDYILRQKN